MHRLTRIAAITTIAGLTLLLAACGGGDDAGAGPDDAAQTAAAAALFSSPAGQVLTLEMTDLKFSTKTLAATSGQVVEVGLANKGGIEHDFTMQKLPGEKAFRVGGKDTDVSSGGNDVHAHLEPGETGVVRLKASAPGTYDFFCTVPGHKEAGMRGTFTVQ